MSVIWSALYAEDELQPRPINMYKVITESKETELGFKVF